MEQVLGTLYWILGTYARPYNPFKPVVCFGEKFYRLLDHLRDPQSSVPRIPDQVGMTALPGQRLRAGGA
ncbi:hypothetical protein [Deinococcus sp.]|uniref:hypothetical protein n=1 Tax=Deinococcus sp. TaxID=47478 RepID=UPI003C7A81CF